MKGGEEMTLVQPEGVPARSRAVVSRNTAGVTGRASGALLTGPTPLSGGCRQTPQGEPSGCQGRPILTPAREQHHRGRSRRPRCRSLGWSECDCPGGDQRWRRGHIFDPFCGTGTVGAVAVGHGRDFTGIDLDARNADLARDRIGMWLDVEHQATGASA